MAHLSSRTESSLYRPPIAAQIAPSEEPLIRDLIFPPQEKGQLNRGSGI
jgi:hypothetical protein